MTRTREENAADMAAEDARPKTRAVTIMAMLSELIEIHMAKCDDVDGPGFDAVPHVLSEVHGTSANIDTIGTGTVGASHMIELQLDDGSAFTVTVEET